MNKNTVYIAHSSAAYIAMFTGFGFKVVSQAEEAAIICFTGGADVSPGVYGDAKHAYTQNDEFRDAKEAKLFKWAQENGVPCVGVCRGAQFLNCMSGGRMYQHVEKHCGDHSITDLSTGETIYVSSTHHQMIMPGKAAVMVAVGNQQGSREWYDGQVFKRDVSGENGDAEVVYYPHTGSLCFQPHPEFAGERYINMRSYFRDCIGRFLSV